MKKIILSCFLITSIAQALVVHDPAKMAQSITHQIERLKEWAKHHQNIKQTISLAKKTTEFLHKTTNELEQIKKLAGSVKDLKNLGWKLDQLEQRLSALYDIKDEKELEKAVFNHDHIFKDLEISSKGRDLSKYKKYGKKYASLAQLKKENSFFIKQQQKLIDELIKNERKLAAAKTAVEQRQAQLATNKTMAALKVLKARQEVILAQITAEQRKEQLDKAVKEQAKKEDDNKQLQEQITNFGKQWRVKPGSFERIEEFRKKLFERMNRK